MRIYVKRKREIYITVYDSLIALYYEKAYRVNKILKRDFWHLVKDLDRINH